MIIRKENKSEQKMLLRKVIGIKFIKATKKAVRKKLAKRRLV